MGSKFYPVTYDRYGVFFAQVDENRKTFKLSDGSTLTTQNTPSGSWPICFVKDDEDLLYFTYFLSSTLHAWSLTPVGQRNSGHKAAQSEIIPHMQANVADVDFRWHLAKLLPEPIKINSFGVSPSNEFSALEFRIARAILNGQPRELMPEDLEDDSRERAPTWSDPDIERHLAVPDGYRDAVAVTDGRTRISNIWDFSAASQSKFNLAIIAEINGPFLSTINNYIAGTCVRIRQRKFNKFTRAVCCEVSYDPNSISSTLHCKTLHLTLDETVLTLDLEKDGRDILRRLSFSLEVLLPHILRLLDLDQDGFKLRFSFADEGNDGYLSFDKIPGTDRVVIPDLYLLADVRSNRYYPSFDLQSFTKMYVRKRPVLFWRGSTTGSLMHNIEDLKQNPRVRACLSMQEQLGELADCKIADIVQFVSDQKKSAINYLREMQIKDDFVPEEFFALHQLYIDLPGNAAAWGTFRKFLYGCAVIRPLPIHRELAYYACLEPGKDFIPVASDLSNIGATVREALANPERTAAIAFSGRAKVLQYINDLPRAISDIFHQDSRASAERRT